MARPRGAVEVDPSSRGKLSRVKVTVWGEGAGLPVLVWEGCWQAARVSSKAPDRAAARMRFIFMSGSSFVGGWDG